MIELHVLNRSSVAAARLQQASDFVEVGTAVIGLGMQLFGLHQMQVSLVSAAGRPFITVENIPGITDELRFAYQREMWVIDPILRAVRELHAPVGDEVISAQQLIQLSREHGYTGDFVHTYAMPVLEPAGMIGIIVCGHKQPFSIEMRRELGALSTHVSLRMVQLGISTLREDGLEQLTVRQFEVAQLAARGRTNDEVAQMLGLSSNTVKKHLKEVFARAKVANRTELAAVISRVAPRDVYPAGITRLETVTVTKAQ